MKSFFKTVLIVSLIAPLAAASLAAQKKLPPKAQRTFSDPAIYVPDMSEQPASSELRDLVTRYVLDRQLLNRFYIVSGSRTRREKLAAFYAGWLKELPNIDFDGLSHEGKADYVLLRNRIEYDQALLGRDERIQQRIAPLVPFSEDIVQILEARQRLEFIGADQAVTSIKEIHDLVKGIQADVDSGKLTAKPAVVVKALRHLSRIREALYDWFDFYHGYDPDFTAKVPMEFEALNLTLDMYSKTIGKKLGGLPPGAIERASRRRRRDSRRSNPPRSVQQGADLTPLPIIGDPIGREGLLEDLRGEMIIYTPEQLIKIGNREYAWTLTELKKAARDMGFGDDWHAALEKVKENYVPRGKQPDLIRNLQIQAENFIRKHDLVTIPPIVHDTWRMRMMPPQTMLRAPFFLGGESIMVSYPVDGMSKEMAQMIMKGNSPHLSHATVFHELIPGHGQQGFMLKRYNTHRNTAFSTPFHGEGWCLFWEMLMWDLGFNATPEDRIGALFWRLHRAARIVFTLNYQMGLWTPQRCIDFLVSNGHERFTAESEVRGHVENSPPLYQASYLIGGLQVRSLYRELVTDGKLMTTKQFNDAMLRTGSMPIEILRALLGNKPLARDYRAQWKFYGDIPEAK